MMGEPDDVKLKSRSEAKEGSRRSRQEKEKEKDREKERNGDRERRRDREKEKEKDKDRESRRLERERSVDDKHTEKEKVRDREKPRDKHRDRKRDREEREDREREKARDREREKERDREREKEREREREKEKERERDRREEREKERERERREEREKEKEREKERERERREEREKEKERERRRREAETDDSSDERRGRERKRRRRDEDHKEKDKERSRLHRHREDSVDSQKKKSVDEPEKVQEKAETKGQDMEEEQRILDDEAEKRRRRVQEWQELKRKKEEEVRQQLGEEDAGQPRAGKKWTLEGESDDEEAAPEAKSDTEMDVDGAPKPSTEDGDSMAVDSENGNSVPDVIAATGEEEEVDPLDAFMNSILPEVEKMNNPVLPPEQVEVNGNHKKDDQSDGEVRRKKESKKLLGRIRPDDDSDQDHEDDEEDEKSAEDEDDDEFMKRVKKTKAEKLAVVDHSKIDYIDFRKNFYIEVKEIVRMTTEEVVGYRKDLELKVHGKDVPKPIKTWHQTGLSTKVLEVLRKLNFEKPMSIQAQALPVIMSGRDCIGIAKTGSGKTLAFVLPMLRHIKDQPPLMSGDGPIGLIMAPTRELVQQIYSDIRKFTKVMNLTCVPIYGGSGVAQQIGDLKKGAEIVVCTPGRMIDILCTSSGKITNLRRVTYLVMDEADRMFDMGFEPQITRIVQNIRPDRQTVLFSATFPRQVEVLAKKVLNKPVEIEVGGRSVVNKDITQMVEVRPESDRYLRLLEILGEWYEKGKILIFVQTQDNCDTLFRNLLKSGYPCLSLHGAKDQGDRESTLADFKSNVCNLLVATSIAARGLDVKDLEIVINYDVPRHYEDYVHRVGRTGRAGRKGHAVTFISEDEDKFAPDLLKALQLSQQPIPEDLRALADGFNAKVKQGLVQPHATGFGGKGYKFDEQEDEAQKAAKKAQAMGHGYEFERSDSEDEDDEVRKRSDVTVPNSAPAAQETGPLATTGPLPESIMSKLQHSLAKLQQNAMAEHYEAELEINEFPQNARWKVTHKETLGPISEWTGAAITTRGQFFPPGKIPAPGERKLYLFIEGRSEHSVKTAKAELKRVLEDITAQAISLPGGTQPGRYTIA